MEKEHRHIDDGLSCNCGHCHSNDRKVSEQGDEKSKFYYFVKDYGLTLSKIFVSTILLVLGLLLNVNSTAKIIIFSVSFVIIGYQTLIDCIKLIVRGKFFNENLLMLIASIVAFVLGEYYEGVIILLLYTLGELLEEIATDNSRKRIAGLSELKVAKARLVDKNGISEVDPKAVPIGSLIEIRKGDRVPIDGQILGMPGVFDFKAVTGESKLVTVENGNNVFSGAINVGDSVIIKTTKRYQDSTVSKIIALVEGANAKKAKSQKFIATFSKYYTPLVVLVGVIIATIIPLFDGMNFIKWIYKGLNFIVISCPCALVISVPLSFFIGIGSLSRQGVLVKGSSYIDTLSEVSTVVFDKTGTLTKGDFYVDKVEIIDDSISNEYLGQVVLTLENSSSHPIAKATCNHYKGFKIIECQNVTEVLGKGVSGEIGGKKVIVGNDKFLIENNIKIDDCGYAGTVLYVAITQKLVAIIFISDQIKGNAKKSIEQLKKNKINKTCMISGDNATICNDVGRKLGIDEVYSELLPEEKYESLKRLISSSEKGKVMYVGDGVNDAPSIALADIGVSMGALGSDSAIECADIVIMDDDIGKIPLSIKYAKRIKRKVLQNIIGSLGIKLGIMILSIVIPLPIWVAMLADVGVMLLAVANSLTNYMLKYEK